MAKKINLNKRIVSLVLCLALFLSLLPVMAQNTMAATTFVSNRKADVSTMDDWKKFFGPDVLNTENAGGVWGDKSVFTNADAFSDYGITMTDADSNFLVALSAIASNKSIVGYSAIPTDTVMVLDLSNSMSSSSLADMVEATNAAIRELQKLNRNNRVSVIVYAGTRVSNWGGPGGGPGGGYEDDVFGLNESARVLLSLGRYEGVTQNGVENFLRYNYNSDTVSVINGVLDLEQGEWNPSKSASGATYIQAGLQLAWDEFDAVTDTVVAEGPQKGTQRMPVLVLMSDGAPTAATTSFTDVGNSTHGNGSDISSPNAFLTQLSAVWVRTQMEEKYQRSGLFYTLGLDVESNDTARSVLNPAVSTQTLTGWWKNYLSATGNTYSTQSFSVAVNSDVKNYFKGEDNTYAFGSYVDEYFQASSNSTAGNELISAFDRIVDSIIIQSKYYPTRVETGDHNLDGYITFTDELGEYMEVKDIKGLTVAGSLYKGSALAQAVGDGDTFGNILSEDPAQLTTAGREMLKAIQRRIGCTEDEAMALAVQAVRNKQIYYNSATDYSNYIGWYADADGNFLGFWDGGEIDRTVGATYANKSYGFLGVVGSDAEYNKTDMLYVSVQVHKHIASGHEQMIYRIPASLVPMVEYEIEFSGTELETGTDFKMSVAGADEPLRLIFEVGLRSDINPVNINDKIDSTYKYKSADGYTFYTNSWGTHDHSEDVALDSHDSAHFEFEPSLENERYYYTSNTAIYDADGNKVTYDPKTVSGTYYLKYVTFETDSAAMTGARMVTTMVEISEDNVDLAVYDEVFKEWVIPKGTPYRRITDPHGTDYAREKADKTITNTLDYSNYPSIFHPSAEADYHAAGCLGNNGVFTVKPEQGISLTKTMEYPELGQGETFTFEITLTGTNLPSSYPVYDYDGNLLATATLASGNKLTVNVQTGQTVYVAGISTGTQYSVVEILPSGSEWKVNKTTNASGTVALYEFANVTFENTPTTYGNLLINKTVKHPFGDSYVLPDKVFDVTVTFTSGVADGTSVTVDGQIKTVSGGKLDLTIRDGQTVVVSGIPDGAAYTVTEASYPGFTLSGTGLSGTIDDSKNAEALLVNTYAPEGPDLNLTHVGIKHLDGREWLEGDKFTFTLQYFNGLVWENVSSETKTVTKNTANYSFSFDDLLADFAFATVGTYQFRVLESYVDIGGVVCDTVGKRFAVTVEDDALSGKLKISNVNTTTPNNYNSKSGTVVSYDTEKDEWTVTTHFNNVYSVRGTASVAVNVTKNILNDTGVAFGKDGFTFQIWEIHDTSEVLIGTTDATDANGATGFTFSLDAERLGQTMTYKVVEVVDGKEGVLYDSTVKTFTVTLKDNLDGSVSALINGQNTNVYSATFTNTYDLADATVTVTGEKELTGRDLIDGEFVFELYKCADSSFASPVRVDRQYNSGKNITLTDTVSAAGTYYYIVKEVTSQLPNVTSDTAEFRVTASVTKGEGATLKAEITSVTKNGTDASVKFTNVYKPDPTGFAIFGAKTMEGRNPREGEFTFLLFNEAGQQIDSVTNNANGNFVFPEIEYTEKGTYVYTVKEDLSDKKSYIIYDESVFTVTVTVTDDGAGNLSKSVAYSKNGNAVSGIAFHNTYKPTAIQNTIEGYKTMTGRDPAAEEFTFLLFDESGNQIDSATNGTGGKFSFDALEYTKAGVYTYTVRESTADAKDYIVYDETVYVVTVTVTDDGAGNLSKSVAYRHGSTAADGISFNNVYTPESIYFSVSGVKTMTGRNPKAGEFTFVLYNDKNEPIRTATNDVNGNFTFEAVEFTHGGTYTYTVREDLSDKKSYITYDESVFTVTVTVSDDGTGGLTKTVTYKKGNASADGITFENVYKPTPVGAVIEGTKILSGRDPKDGEFTFLLIDSAGKTVDTATNKNGTFAFDEQTFSKAGVYTFTVKEDLSSKKSYIVYDETVFTVTVTVTDDTVGGLTAKVAYSSAGGALHDISFHNRYVPTAIQSTILGHKDLAGRKLLDGEFTFLLMNAKGEVLDETVNEADGTIAFEPRLYHAAGVYTYLVKEDVSVPKDGVEFDSNEYTVTVTVTDDGVGNLSSQIVYVPKEGSSKDLVFNNVFTPAPVDVTFSVTKILQNTTDEKIGLDGFEFKLAGDGITSATVKSDANGKAAFTAISYTSEDIGKTFHYTVTEVDGGMEYMSYDKSEVKISVTVTVTDEGIIVPVITQDGKTVDGVNVTFTNVYHKNPDTSDVNLHLWILLGVLGGGSAAALILKKREASDEE